MFAAASGHGKVVKRLIEAHAPVDEMCGALPSGPLEAALMCGDVESCEALRQAGAQWPKDERIAKRLVDAASHGWTATVRWLLNNGSPKAVHLGLSPALLELAVGSADEDIGRLLLDAGANPNVVADSYHKNISALTAVCREGKFDFAAVLIEKGASVDKEDANGSTPLELMAAWDRAEAIHFLLAHGANLNHGKPPVLAVALRNNSAAGAKVIAEAGGEIDLANPEASYLLATAIRMDVSCLIDTALRKGWDGKLILRGKTWSAVALAQAFNATETVKSLSRIDPVMPKVDCSVILPKISAKGAHVVQKIPLHPPQPVSPHSNIPFVLRFEAILDRHGNVIIAGIPDRPDASNLDQIIQEISNWRFSLPAFDGDVAAACISFPVKINTDTSRIYELHEVEVFPHLVSGPALPKITVGTDVLRGIYFTVRTDGTVTDAKVSPIKYSREAEAALQAIAQWKFTPAQLKSSPVAVRIFQPLP
jgi:hypothetical protein